MRDISTLKTLSMSQKYPLFRGFTMYVCPQVVLVCLLWGLKLSPAGMIYPVAIVGLVPIRMFLRRFVFSHAEMEAVSELDTICRRRVITKRPRPWGCGDLDSARKPLPRLPKLHGSMTHRITILEWGVCKGSKVYIRMCKGPGG